MNSEVRLSLFPIYKPPLGLRAAIHEQTGPFYCITSWPFQDQWSRTNSGVGHQCWECQVIYKQRGGCRHLGESQVLKGPPKWVAALGTVTGVVATGICFCMCESTSPGFKQEGGKALRAWSVAAVSFALLSLIS